MAVTVADTRSYHDVIEVYRAQYESRLSSGDIAPFVIPFNVSNWALLFGYLAALRQWPSQTHRLRYPVFAAISWLSLSTMRNCRTIGLNYGVLLGVTSCWCIIWSASLVIVYNPLTDMERIVRIGNHTKSAASSPDRPPGSRQDTEDMRAAGLTWQPMPYPLLERLRWITDLVWSLRGSNWSWGVHRTRRRRPFHQNKRGEDSKESALFTPSSICKFLALYLALDALKFVSMRDPYFWGLVEDPAPRPLDALPPSWVHTCRLLVSLANLYASNLLLFGAAPLLSLPLLSPLLHHWSAPWQYSPVYGPLSSIAERGLRGFWGTFWHQSFRFAFSSAAGPLVDRLPCVNPESGYARFLQSLVAFALSGALHAAGCYTQWPRTSPTRVFMFFLAQPFGILLSEALLAWPLAPGGKARRAANVAWAALWLRLTFPLMADEYARGGMWLFEPFPVSVVRGLVEGRWWCWGDLPVRWYVGGRWWWHCGVAL